MCHSCWRSPATGPQAAWSKSRWRSPIFRSGLRRALTKNLSFHTGLPAPSPAGISLARGLAKTPASADPGILVTRAALAENNGGKWMEVFRCDEHLKNPSGFLGGTPITPVTGWRLQYQQNAERGLQLYFTPLESPGGGHIPTIGVRWNPKVKRHHALDRNLHRFLSEVPTLDRFYSHLK